MAIENTAIIYVNGINLTHYAVMPLKWGNFLDEQLDEMYLSLRHGPFEHIKPLTPVEIHLKNRFYFGSTTVDTRTKVKRFLVANDNSEESPVGSKRYNHDLYLIEVTKFAECVVVDTITFTNDLGRNYTKGAATVIPAVEEDHTAGTVWPETPPVTPTSFVSPLPTGNFTFPSAHTIFPYENSGAIGKNSHNRYIQVITNQTGDEIFSNTYTVYGAGGGTEGQDIGATIELQNTSYTVKYTYEIEDSAVTRAEKTISATYQFQATENEYPLKQWTITDVINRLLDLAEPLRQGERPRFILQGIDPSTGAIQAGSQAARFDKILAPQFSFTKQTLRECLKEIGGVVHGEPRLDIAQDSDGNYYYEVSFDLYGQTDRAGIYAKPYIQKTVSQVVDSYASCLDSNAENLVNQLDKLAGVIVEPYSGGYKTVRTETMYARITDANMLIQTQYPIYTIEKLECGFIPNNTSIPKPINLTPYVFESSMYNTRLSSYEELYPYSKAYGITFTQGQKNLTALNFKDPDAVSGAVFSNYAIVNILRSATGNQSLNITDYPLLAFRVTYTPFYNSRVGQTKVNYQDYPRAAALIYNQQANVIESRYYGENLKGVIARLGNVDKSITYNLARLSDIPKAGQMYNDDYYISTVAVELLPTYIKCTIGLSKDFNRLSQYIGVSSVKRYSEVSQGQAVERNTLWKEYIVIGDEDVGDIDCDINNYFMSALRDTFLQTGNYLPVTQVTAYGGTYNQPLVEETRVDIEDETSVTFSNDDFTVTITTTAKTEQRIRADVSMYFNTNDVSNENTSFYSYFYGESTTVDAREKTSVWGELTKINSVTLQRAYYNDAKYPLPLVSLPVVSSAFGNSIAFSWEYEDNYSAGAISQYAENGDVTGYSQNNYQYTDYYGRIYYYNFALQEFGAQILQPEQQNEIGTELPGGDITYANRRSFIRTYNPRVLRKDNREAMQCNFQVDLVSNRKGLIVGSALASYCPLIRAADSSLAAKLYIFNEPLDKFIYHVEGSLDVELDDLTAYDITVNALDTSDGTFSVTAANFPVSGKAWAIITGQTGETTTVEDEEGNITTQTIQKGGDVLIAQNMDISAGDAFPTVYFTKKREVFDKSVWIANR